MKTNQATHITGKKVILVPYRKSHVPKYHVWMQNPEIQTLTASEPLTLEQEYAMQQSWRDDDNKCTFIILSSQIHAQTQDEIESMVGDVNLFFNDEDNRQSAEVEIMIAEPSSRGQGLGKEALLSMMYYGMTALGVKQYTAKIGDDNTPSINMFNKLGYKQISHSAAFSEVTLELPLDAKTTQWLTDASQHLHIQQQPDVT